MVRCHFAPTRMTTTKKITGVHNDVETLGLSRIAGENVTWCSCFKKQSGGSSKGKTYNYQRIQPLCPRSVFEGDENMPTETCTQMWMEALFTIVKNRKNPNKMHYIHTVEY